MTKSMLYSGPKPRFYNFYGILWFRDEPALNAIHNGNLSSRYFKLPAMLIGIDVSRHKEIATKAISGL